MVIDQQEKIRDGSVRETWALFSYARPKAHLLTTSRWLVVVLPTAAVRPPGTALSGPSLPAQYIPADANGGLCIGRSCADVLGGWGPSATNKLHWVYTGALLATMVKAPKERRISALFSGSYPSYNGRESALRCIA